jgi:signal transduction histidine kinase
VNLFRVALFLLLFMLQMDLRAEGERVFDLQVLVDAEGTETISSVSAPSTYPRYEAVTGKFNAGYTHKVHWLRFKLQAPQKGPFLLEVLPGYLDHLTLFEPNGVGFIEHRTGDLLPFSSRELDYRSFVFKLDIPDKNPRVFYFCLQSSSASLMDIKLWRPEHFYSAKNVDYAILGFYFGFLILALMIDLALCIWLKETLFGWFGLIIFSNMFLHFGLKGLASQYLFPDMPELTSFWTSFGILFLIATFAPFYFKLLAVTRDQTFLYWMLHTQWLLPCALLLSIPFDFFQDAVNVLYAFSLVSAIVTTYVIVQQWKLGKQESIYVLLGVSIFAISGFFSALIPLGLIPQNKLSQSQIGQVLSMLGSFLVCFSLGVRVRRERTENQQTSARALLAEKGIAQGREAYEKQGRFIAMLSHEFKTPLAVIDSATQALERINRNESQELTLRYKRIRSSVDRIDRLVMQFLTTDKFDSQGMTMSPERIQLSQLLREIIHTECNDEQEVVLVCPPSVSLLELSVDIALLTVAITNILDNSLKYSTPGTAVTVTVNFSSDKGMPGVEIVIADKGPSIPVELRDLIFSRYERGQNITGITGAGLGLYLVKLIMEMHAGQVSLLPNDEGAVFRIWLPLDGGELL